MLVSVSPHGWPANDNCSMLKCCEVACWNLCSYDGTSATDDTSLTEPLEARSCGLLMLFV